jgi:phosphoglucomutase
VQIIEEVNAVTDYAGAKTMSRKEAEAAGLYQVIGDEIDDQYMKALKSLVIHPEIIREEAQNLKIVYTPLHGTGNIPVRRILKELGFENVYVVKEQDLSGTGRLTKIENPMKSRLWSHGNVRITMEECV